MKKEKDLDVKQSFDYLLEKVKKLREQEGTIKGGYVVIPKPEDVKQDFLNWRCTVIINNGCVPSKK